MVEFRFFAVDGGPGGMFGIFEAALSLRSYCVYVTSDDELVKVLMSSLTTSSFTSHEAHGLEDLTLTENNETEGE